MSFLRRVAGVSLRDRVRSSAIREELGLEPLLLYLERSQLRWFGHLVRMPTGRLPWEVFQARPVGRRPRGRPRTRWRDYISTLAWERLGIPPSDCVRSGDCQPGFCCVRYLTAKRCQRVPLEGDACLLPGRSKRRRNLERCSCGQGLYCSPAGPTVSGAAKKQGSQKLFF
uniref:Dickkopf-related protein 1/2/4 C-terminal subdomain 1 domain-containing protein n=1 Tax=Gadus morhua TaxID=8049 RepID=A0A8C5B2H5_GADMO